MSTQFDVIGESRHESRILAGEVHNDLTEAIAPLAGIGRGIQAAERAVITAVASGLWLAHGKLPRSVDRMAVEAVVGTLQLGMSSAGWPGTYAHSASVLLGRVLRFTPDAPMTKAECIAEADHMASFMFAQQTKRRDAERKKREEAKKAKKAEEAAEKAAADAEKAESTPPADAPEPLQALALISPTGEVTHLSEEEYLILEATLREHRAATAAQASTNRKRAIEKQRGGDSWSAEAARLSIPEAASAA